MQAWNESEEQKSKCRSQHDWKGNLSLGPHFPAAHLVYFLIRVIAIPQIFALLSDQHHCSQSTNFSNEHKKQLEVSRSPNTEVYSPNKLALPLQCLIEYSNPYRPFASSLCSTVHYSRNAKETTRPLTRSREEEHFAVSCSSEDCT